MRSQARLLATALVGVAALTGTAHGGGDEPTPVSTAAPAPSPAPLDLSIRARALGIVSEPLVTPTLDLEARKATTGAGSLRMPSSTVAVGRGVYVGVSPACLPGLDDASAPFRRRTSPLRR